MPKIRCLHILSKNTNLYEYEFLYVNICFLYTKKNVCQKKKSFVHSLFMRFFPNLMVVEFVCIYFSRTLHYENVTASMKSFFFWKIRKSCWVRHKHKSLSLKICLWMMIMSHIFILTHCANFFIFCINENYNKLDLYFLNLMKCFFVQIYLLY